MNWLHEHTPRSSAAFRVLDAVGWSWLHEHTPRSSAAFRVLDAIACNGSRLARGWRA